MLPNSFCSFMKRIPPRIALTGMNLLKKEGRMKQDTFPMGFQDMMSFGLIEALLGRRSRRFFMGAEIPDGVFAYKSRQKPVPLTDLEKMLVVSACGGNTSWHHMIYRGARYAPHLSNYAGAAGGRVFPSAAGFTQARLFSRTMRGCTFWRCATRQPSPNGRTMDR